MALFTISDLHLSFGTDKPMDVFSHKWANHAEKIKNNWNTVITSDDIVVVGGDLSWGMRKDDTESDFEFLNSLNGRKILIKGNHDYWWSTLNKLNCFVLEKGYKNISFLQNNAIDAGNYVVCGTRGWLYSDDCTKDEDVKIYNRELLRLENSLEDSKKFGGNPVVFMHYPPYKNFSEPDYNYVSLMKEYGVSACIFGHIHGDACNSVFKGEYENIKFLLASSDYLDFMPIKISI